MPSEDSSEPSRRTRPRIFSKFMPKKPAPVQPTQSPVPTSTIAVNLKRLGETRVADIAIPKADIIAVPVDVDIDSFFAVLRENGYSRVPVYTDSLDATLGLVHVKDIFMNYGDGIDRESFSLEPFLRPIIYAPPSMRLLTLLQRMQSEHIHMALIIDEYGGVDGLVTIEDILEQIVGDITDEHDDPNELLWSQERPGTYIVSARANLQEFSEAVDIDLSIPEDEEIDTIGGLIMALEARVPLKGEIVRSDSGVEYHIIDADPRRIKRVRIVTGNSGQGKI